MPDMLVNLLKLPALEPRVREIDGKGISIRRAQPFEITRVREFIERKFSIAWADESSVAFAGKPVSLYIAIAERELVGFAAYECTRRGFFGPTGVVDSMQRRGIGKALLLACLWSLREMGYVYAIIGGVGPVEFYERSVGAVVIPDSSPGIYTNLLQ